MSLEVAILQLEEAVSQIRQASFADYMTPLKNSLALQIEKKLIDSGQSEFNVLVFGDLNGFKSLNDMHGHEAGDIAIQRVGETIQSDFVEQLGAKAFHPSGDEFIVLIKQEMQSDFIQRTSKFTSIAFSHKGTPLETKMSFGLVVSDGKTDFSDLLERAEVACGIAKSMGQGVCVTWSADIERESFKEFRMKCENCGSTVRCAVPNKVNPKSLNVCPYCSEPYPDTGKLS